MDSDYEKALALLISGEIIGMPTETVYGLAGRVDFPSAIAKIFKIKNRPFFDPLIVHVSSVAMAKGLTTTWTSMIDVLAHEFWPGPLTLVLPKSSFVSDLITAGLGTVGIRMPKHELALKLIRDLGAPLAAPSANPFGYVSPTTAQHVNDQLGDKIPYILDGGPCSVGLESTIVGIEDGFITVYRLGGLSLEEIEDCVGRVLIRKHSSNPQAPGMLDAHYSPRKNLLLGNIDQLLLNYREENPVLICFSAPIPDYPSSHQLILSPSGNITEAAVNLFAYLRLADSLSHSIILAEPVPDTGLGRAINDRLNRAAYK